jgi:hydroxymethylpyrimidine/phosphomethylpyrimidine kinase
MNKKIVLSIAGSDPSCGSGLQADLKAFTALGIHGTTVATCITAQSTQRVKEIYGLSPEIIAKQIDILLEDHKITFVKTGMLYNKSIISCISKKIQEYNLKCVVDPVMISSSGKSLLEEKKIEGIYDELLSESLIVTPNVKEAFLLTGEKIETIDDLKTICRIIYKMGPKYVLIKGGHLNNSQAQDVFYDGNRISTMSLPRIPNKKIRGSGCTLSALITGLLALGEKPKSAVKKAKYILWNMMDQGYSIGKGPYFLNQSSKIISDTNYSFPSKEHFVIWHELKTSIDRLLTLLSKKYVPEVGINIGYALTNAKNLEDICAINGRIINTREKPKICGQISFGASKHIASLIISVMRFNPGKRSIMNIKYSKENLEKFKHKDFKIGKFDRKYEPDNVSSMKWGIKESISHLDVIPDIIYDKGDVGKEPMIRIIGNNPNDVINKLHHVIKDSNKK